jgi:hypothetical protein
VTPPLSPNDKTTVRLIEERRFDPPRTVEVEHDGRWWSGTQTALRLCYDARGWMADVTWTPARLGSGQIPDDGSAERIRVLWGGGFQTAPMAHPWHRRLEYPGRR